MRKVVAPVEGMAWVVWVAGIESLMWSSLLRMAFGLFLLVVYAPVYAQESGTAYGEAYTLDGALLLCTELH